jgi:hypothetical protein
VALLASWTLQQRAVVYRQYALAKHHIAPSLWQQGVPLKGVHEMCGICWQKGQ